LQAADWLVLRQCEEGDIPAITAIYRHAVLNGYGTFEIVPPDEAEMAARRKRLVAASLPYFVAEAGGLILGYAYAGPYHVRAAYRATLEDSIYLRAGSEGRGIGARLLQHLIQAAAAAQFRQMVAVIGDSANKASIRLHEKLGFVHVGTLRNIGFKKDRWLNVVLMQRDLAI
jgi:phosphinothricin acetyltransferase